ncbi:MLP-like protein 43 [Rosa rugosa]|uniref:MLP-like protein 43 n=1 Tax=Rosa rugosa TaxID=74645 RepID=UPI002B409100|nr:MLP-like protein 43 [Rosa rugosa]
MAQIAKIESHAELKSSAEKFYGFFKNNMSSFVQMFPQIFKNFEVVGGGEIRAGSVTKWTYDIGEGVMATKIKIQALDDGNTSITFLVLEGHLLKVYNSFKAKLQLTKAGHGGSIVKWTLEFEKANANSPDLKIYAEQAIKVSKGIDAYLGRA